MTNRQEKAQNMAKTADMEILAPAGSREAALAAINSGANAIYLAGQHFGARAYAANFAEPELAELVHYAHLRGVAVYVALNTLISDEELPEALEQARRLYNLGADALIVQDWGLAAALRREYPQITLNASTQMTLMNSAAVRQAEQAGFSRVILAREVSLGDIAVIHAATSAELEVFVHGALCICFSGQCLFSSLVGGRSGNRGRCAQPCRLSYQLMGERQGSIGRAGHLLSPKDLNGIELLPQLAEAGVCSLKIEGRMKRPEYVAAVTAAYAAAKRGEPYDPKALAQAFNRGFTQAYLQSDSAGEPGHELMSYERPNNRGTRLGRLERIESDGLILKLEAPLRVGDGLEIWVSRGGRQGFEVQELEEIAPGRVRLPLRGLRGVVRLRDMAVGDRVFKTSDIQLQDAGAAAYAAYDTLALYMNFVGRCGERPKLTVTCHIADDVVAYAEVTADYQIRAAEKHPADLALLQKQLGRLGGSGWYLAELTAKLDEGIMLPASVLNQLRRDAVCELEQTVLAQLGYERQELKPRVYAPAESGGRRKAAEIKLAATVADLAGARAAAEAGVELIYWQGWRRRFESAISRQELAQLAALGAYAVLPTIALEGELALWRQRLRQWAEAGLAGVVVNNLWGFELISEIKREISWQPQIVAGYGLNSFNAAAAAAWLEEKGAVRAALSRELNGQQLERLCSSLPKGSCEVQVFGDLEVMNSRHCPIGALCGGKEARQLCRGACREDNYFLQDEKGFCFPVRTDEFCRSHIYNGYQLCLIEEMPRLAGLGAVLQLELASYGAAETGRICRIWRQAAALRRSTGYEAELARLKQELAKISNSKNKMTKGHFFRGVE